MNNFKLKMSEKKSHQCNNGSAAYYEANSVPWIAVRGILSSFLC